MAKGLTQRQEEVLRFIAEYITDHGYAPSYQDIANKFNIASKHGVVRHLEALQRKGFIEMQENTARSIRIVDPRYQPVTAGDSIELPIIGRVAAGLPILAEQNIDDYVAVPRRMIRSEGSYYTLRVQGESMLNAGILDGDLVIVQSRDSAEHNEIVVALIDDGSEATVKRLVKQNESVFLRAENPAFTDIYPHGSWRIQGRVVGLIRDVVH